MKTLKKKLKIGALASAFIFLSSCMDHTTFFNAKDNSTIVESAEKNLSHSLHGNNFPIPKSIQMAGLTKLAVHPNQIITALPISFGTADAISITN